MKKDLAQFDLTPIQYSVLKCVWQNDMHNPKDIANCLGIENSTISGVLERMEKKGLITRNIDTSDRRFIRIDLSKEAQSLEIPVNQVVEEVNEKVLSTFTEKEITEFKSYLDRIIKNV